MRQARRRRSTVAETLPEGVLGGSPLQERSRGGQGLLDLDQDGHRQDNVFAGAYVEARCDPPCRASWTPCHMDLLTSVGRAWQGPAETLLALICTNAGEALCHPEGDEGSVSQEDGHLYRAHGTYICAVHSGSPRQGPFIPASSCRSAVPAALGRATPTAHGGGQQGLQRREADRESQRHKRKLGSNSVLARSRSSTV